MKKKKLLITGAAGFIGSHTALIFLKKGYKLIVLDSFINSNIKVFERLKRIFNFSEDQLQIFEGDIRNSKILNKIFEMNPDIDSVIHFAGLKSVSESINNSLLYWDVNVSGSIKLLTAMKTYKCKSIIFSSSATIYDQNQKFPVSENGKLKPINPYGKTKLTIEETLSDLYSEDPNFWRIGILRYFNPVGAHYSGLIGEDPKNIPNNLMPYIAQVAVGKRSILNIFGNDWPTKDGTGVRDYIHVMDLAEGHMQALDFINSVEPQIIKLNLGTGNGYSVLDLVKAFENTNKCSINYDFVKRREGDVAKTLARVDNAKIKIGWDPKRDINEMCKDMWEWQRKNPFGYED